MKATVDAAGLKKATAWVWGMRGKIGIDPHRQLILLRASADQVAVTITSGYETATTSIPAVVGEPGAALVDGKTLAANVRALGKGAVDLAVDGVRLVLTAGPSRFTVDMFDTTLQPDPGILPPTVAHVDRALFTTAVQQTAPSAGTDDTLPVLTNIYMEGARDGTLTLATTDRYRLAVRALAHSPVAGPWDLLFPAAPLAAAVKRLAGSTVSVHADKVTVAVSDGTTSLIVLEGGDGGKFPPFRKLLPASPRTSITADREQLRTAVRTITAALPYRTAPITLTFTGGTLTLTAGADDAGDRTEVPADHTGPKLAVSVDPKNLADALTVIPGTSVRFDLAGGTDPQVAASKLMAVDDGTDSPDLRIILMPARING